MHHCCRTVVVVVVAVHDHHLIVVVLHRHPLTAVPFSRRTQGGARRGKRNVAEEPVRWVLDEICQRHEGAEDESAIVDVLHERQGVGGRTRAAGRDQNR